LPRIAKSRVAVADAFRRDAHEAWRKHGPRALERLAEENPAKFVENIGKLVPHQIEQRVETYSVIDVLMKLPDPQALEAPVIDGQIVDQSGE